MASTAASTGIEISRDVSLDGLRGVAAVVVVLFHLTGAFRPDWTPDTSTVPVAWVDTPLHLFLHGSLAVSVFFVLSGYVIASTAGRTPLWVLVPLRYLRLVLPALASIVLSWLLLLAFPTATGRFYAAMPSEWLGYAFRDGAPPLAEGVRDAFYGMFVTPGTRWNNVLWTMKMELVGSVLVYAFEALPRKGVFRGVALAAALATCAFRPVLSPFLVGCSLFEVSRSGPVRVRWPLAWLAVGLLVGFPGNGFSERHGLGFLPLSLLPGNRDGFPPVLAASLIVVATLSPGPVRNALSMSWARWLGGISFPLYLVHVPLVLTVGAAAYLAVPAAWGLVAALAAVVPASMVLAAAGERWVDAPLVAGLRRIRRSLAGSRGRPGIVPSAAPALPAAD